MGKGMTMLRRSALSLGLVGVFIPAFVAFANADQLPPSQSGGVETRRLGDKTVQIDNSGKGAVLCIWSIYDAVRLVGRECHAGQDAAFQAELEQSIARIDDFIIANSTSPVSKEQLDARRAQGLRGLQVRGSICAGGAEQLYQMLRRSGPEAIRAQTADLLSIPREPVMNPCL
jgi:hypothetical protein